MGRPLKSDADRRTFKMELRLNLSEKTAIEQNAADAGQEPSVFLRSLGTRTRPSRTVPTPDREVLLRLLAELNKNGSNLNQIARQLNRKQDSDNTGDFDAHNLSIALYGVDTLTRHLMELLK